MVCGAMPGMWGCSGPGSHNHVRLYPSQGTSGAGEAELGEAAPVWGPAGQARLRPWHCHFLAV